MNSASQKGCNLLFWGDRLIDHLHEENQALKSALAQLKQNHETLNFCVVQEILNDSAREVFMLLEAVQSIVDEIDELSIVEELVLVRKELKELQAEGVQLEKEFRP